MNTEPNEAPMTPFTNENKSKTLHSQKVLSKTLSQLPKMSFLKSEIKKVSSINQPADILDRVLTGNIKSRKKIFNIFDTKRFVTE
jgi:hypothetical protein